MFNNTYDNGGSTFNMSLQTLKRIDILIQSYHQYKRMEFYKGNPLYNDLINIELCLYIELRPQITTEEKETGDAYRTILKLYPITQVNRITKIPPILNPIMDEYMDWMMEMLSAHKILMAMGDDPGDVIE